MDSQRVRHRLRSPADPRRPPWRPDRPAPGLPRRRRPLHLRFGAVRRRPESRCARRRPGAAGSRSRGTDSDFTGAAAGRDSRREARECRPGVGRDRRSLGGDGSGDRGPARTGRLALGLPGEPPGRGRCHRGRAPGPAAPRRQGERAAAGHVWRRAADGRHRRRHRRPCGSTDLGMVISADHWPFRRLSTRPRLVPGQMPQPRASAHRAVAFPDPELRHRHRSRLPLQPRLRRDVAVKCAVVPGRLGLLGAQDRPGSSSWPGDGAGARDRCRPAGAPLRSRPGGGAGQSVLRRRLAAAGLHRDHHTELPRGHAAEHAPDRHRRRTGAAHADQHERHGPAGRAVWHRVRNRQHQPAGRCRPRRRHPGDHSRYPCNRAWGADRLPARLDRCGRGEHRCRPGVPVATASGSGARCRGRRSIGIVGVGIGRISRPFGAVGPGRSPGTCRLGGQ